jgi:hypothetical protein
LRGLGQLVRPARGTRLSKLKSRPTLI